MRTYVRGDLLPPEFASTLSNYAKRKWWLVDNQGHPTGKPYARRWEIEFTQPDRDYVIVTGKRTGRPRKYADDNGKKKAHDEKRASDPERKEYKATKARERRAKPIEGKQ